MQSQDGDWDMQKYSQEEVEKEGFAQISNRELPVHGDRVMDKSMSTDTYYN